MPKKETTSFTASSDLKTALAAKGLVTRPDVNEVYYNGANEFHFLVADLGNQSFSCIIVASGGVDFDEHSISDPSYVRRFTERELKAMIGNYPNVSNLQQSQQGANWTVTITQNNIPRTGTSQNIADAHALAFIAVLNAS